MSSLEDRLITQEDLDLFLLVHRATRNDVRAFADVVPGLQPSQGDRAKALHHEAEDKDFCPLLTEKDPSFGRHQERIARDHQELLVRIGEVKQDFDLLAQAGNEDFIQQRDVLAPKMVALRDFLEGHMDHEEQDLVGCAKSCLTFRELRDLENKGGRRIPIKDLSLVLPWVVSVANDAERRNVMSILPLPVRLLYRFWWRARFDRKMNPLTTS